MEDPKIGEVWKFPGYKTNYAGQKYASGAFFTIKVERVTETSVSGTCLSTSPGSTWSEESGVKVGNFIVGVYAKMKKEKKVFHTNVVKAADSQKQFFEERPDLLPVKEVEKIVTKEVERIVEVRVERYEETIIDHLYNWYCKKKSKRGDQLV